MSQLPKTGYCPRLWLPCIIAWLLATDLVQLQEAIACAQDITLTRGEEKAFELVLKDIGELRSLTMDKIVKESESKIFLSLASTKNRSVPAIGYFDWEGMLRHSQFYDHKLIRIESAIEPGKIPAASLIAALRKQYGKPNDGLKYESVKPFEWVMGESKDFTVKKYFHWDTRFNFAPLGEKPFEMPVTIEVAEVEAPEIRTVEKNGKVEVTPKVEAVLLSVSDSEQLENAIKALARK